MNFRTLLLVTLIPAATVVIGLLSFFTYTDSSENLLKKERKSLQQIARKTVLELDMWLGERVLEIGGFSKIDLFKEACKGKKLEETRQKLEAFKNASPMYENMFLADAVTGKVFLDAVGGKTVGFEFSKHPAGRLDFEAALRGEIHIGEPTASPLDGNPVFAYTSPIYSEGELVGMIGSAVQLKYFSEIFIDPFKMGQSGYIYMIDSKGRLIAHPDKENLLKLNLNDYDFGKDILKKKKGGISYEKDGETRFTVFDQSARTGWIVNVGLPYDELMMPVRHIRNISIGLGAIFIFILCGVIWSVSAYLFRIISRSTEEVKAGSDRILSAAGQMTAHSRSLSEGASEQAASIEETSSSLEEMAAVTRRNADNAADADGEIKRSLMMLEKAGSAVSELSIAMKEIHAAGEESSRIVSAINTISFQTNLLALNAAVEAARAGETGAGFAVVAEEVRNLAVKTGEAAENTSAIIRKSGDKITEGTGRLAEVDETFSLLEQSIRKSAGWLGEIASASGDQARGIDQLNIAAAQVDQVVQRNAASAEEAASASEEMHAQTEKIIDSIDNLVKLVRGNRNPSQ